MTVPRVAGFAAILLVIGIVAAAFSAIGPPSRARAEALDHQRVVDLGDIAEQLHEDHTQTAAGLTHYLPAPRHDPLTGKPYEFRQIDAFRYDLCAVFQLPTPTQTQQPDEPAFWRHGSGRHCYRLDVRRPVDYTSVGVRYVN